MRSFWPFGRNEATSAQEHSRNLGTPDIAAEHPDIVGSMSTVELIDALVKFGVPDSIVADVPAIPEGTRGVILYGSRARRDEVEGSDLDLLALVSTPHRAIHSGAVSISFYTPSQLDSGVGTLFGAHLKRDGKVLFDCDGSLTQMVEDLGEVDTGRLLGRVSVMSQLFTTPQHDLPKYLPGLLREARYLLRSSLYAQAIAKGEPCFSVRELAVRHGDDSLVSLLASRQQDIRREDYDSCVAQLRALNIPFQPSAHGSLEATVVNEWGVDSDLLSMAFMALGSAGGGSDYAEVEKILL